MYLCAFGLSLFLHTFPHSLVPFPTFFSGAVEYLLYGVFKISIMSNRKNERNGERERERERRGGGERKRGGGQGKNVKSKI